MSNHEELKKKCKDNDKKTKTLGIPTVLIKLMRSIDIRYGIEQAAFLSQIIYWSDRSKRDDGFFYKTDREWEAELGLTTYKLQKSRKLFEALGYIEIKKDQVNGSQTHIYKVNMDRIFNDLDKLYKNEKIVVNEEMLNEQVINNNLDMQESLISEIQEICNSELQETNNSITENKQKLHHNLGLTKEKINFSTEELESYSEESKYFKETVYDEFLDLAMEIFRNEKIDDKKQHQLRSIIDDMNCCSRNSPMYSCEKPDYAYISEKFLWASKTARDDPDFRFDHLISAITNPDNLVKHHNYHKKIIERFGFDRERIHHPLEY